MASWALVVDSIGQVITPSHGKAVRIDDHLWEKSIGRQQTS